MIVTGHTGQKWHGKNRVYSPSKQAEDKMGWHDAPSDRGTTDWRLATGLVDVWPRGLINGVDRSPSLLPPLCPPKVRLITKSTLNGGGSGEPRIAPPSGDEDPNGSEECLRRKARVETGIGSGSRDLRSSALLGPWSALSPFSPE